MVSLDNLLIFCVKLDQYRPPLSYYHIPYAFKVFFYNELLPELTSLFATRRFVARVEPLVSVRGVRLRDGAVGERGGANAGEDPANAVSVCFLLEVF